MFRRLVQHSIVFGYLAITFGAFVYTMSRIEILPKWVTRWSYGMMAPYQGDTPWNADFVYEGRLPGGAWKRIDIDAYMPYGFGERNARKFFRVYDDAARRGKFAGFALLLLDRERAHGRPYEAVRITYEQWDRSPAGYEFLRLPAFTMRQLLTEVAL